MAKTAAGFAFLLFLLTPDFVLAKIFHLVAGCERAAKKQESCTLLTPDGLTITMSPAVKGLRNKPDKLVTFFNLRIENKSDAPRAFEMPAETYLREASGRVYRYQPPDTAIAQLIERSAAMRTIFVGAMMGPLAGGNLTKAIEQQIHGTYGAKALRPGSIPAASFIEGIIFFETFDNDDKRELELVVPTWPRVKLEYR